MISLNEWRAMPGPEFETMCHDLDYLLRGSDRPVMVESICQVVQKRHPSATLGDVTEALSQLGGLLETYVRVAW